MGYRTTSTCPRPVTRQCEDCWPARGRILIVYSGLRQRALTTTLNGNILRWFYLRFIGTFWVNCRYYKRQAFLVHPDKNPLPGAEEAFKILVHAFDMIGEPERRAAYDRGTSSLINKYHYTCPLTNRSQLNTIFMVPKY